MNSQNKILYEHLKDYPTSSEGYHDIGNRAVPATWAHKRGSRKRALRNARRAD